MKIICENNICQNEVTAPGGRYRMTRDELPFFSKEEINVFHNTHLILIKKELVRWSTELQCAVHKLSSEHRVCFYFNNPPDRKIIPMHELTIVFLWFPTYDSFLVPSFCKDQARSLNFARHLFWLSTTKGRNIVKLSAISQNHQFQLILTDGFNLQILKNRWPSR